LSRRRLLVHALTVTAAWGGAMLVPAGSWPASLCAFAAVALLPGWFLDAALEGNSKHGDSGPTALERPARAFALSVAAATLLGFVAAAAGAGIAVVIWGQLAVTGIALLAGYTSRATRTCRPVPTHEPSPWPCVTIIATAAAFATMALGAPNIARDRMWYMAYLTDLAGGGALDWAEPFLGTGHVLARFAYNGCLLTLAAWQRLAEIGPLLLFEHHAPLLLALLMVSATLALSRALFGPGRPAAVVTCTSLWVVLATRFPFFAPDRYPLFGRLPEDKTVALLILLPVALGVCVDHLRTVGPRPASRYLLPGGMLLAVAASHAIVYLLLLLSIVALAVAFIARAGCRPRDAAAAVALASVVAAGPALVGFVARGQIVELPATASAFADLSTHPVVRSHDRMQRLVDLPGGGPIVDPSLLAEPLLLFCVVGGLFVSIARRREAWATFLLVATAIFTVLAFTPWLSPAFGRLVVPWMAYRTLWGIPFGLLLGATLLEGPTLVGLPGRSRAPAALILTSLVAAISWTSVPWSRLAFPASTGERSTPRSGLVLSEDTRAILREIATLPPDTIVAAAPGFAEVVPALAGRKVLAFSDRGTVVFAGSLHEAQRRMRAAAALVGLRGGSRRMRNRIVGAYGVTHTVYDGHGCDRRAAPIARAGSLRLCAERVREHAKRFLPLSTAVATASARGALIARLGPAAGSDTQHALFDCRPAPVENKVTGSALRALHWKRDSRWTAKPVTVDCVARPLVAERGGRLRIAMVLPRANEAIVYRISMFTEQGMIIRKHGALDFRGNPDGEIRLPDVTSRKLRVRLAPAYLPYLNVEALEWRR
jgi:hypothetical protein